MGDWAFAVDMLLGNKQVSAALTRLTGLTTDVRILYRPFIPAMTSIAAHELDYLSVPVISAAINAQLELSGWGTGTAGVSKLRGLPHPALGVLIISKHLAYAGRTDFSLAQVEDEYLRFARTRLIGSGRTRWPLDVLRRGFDHCRTLGLLAPAGPASAGPRFAKVRATISPHEVVAFFRGEGGNILGPELGSWGKLSGGHV
jgi:origin recognition complex subunit 4